MRVIDRPAQYPSQVKTGVDFVCDDIRADGPNVDGSLHLTKVVVLVRSGIRADYLPAYVPGPGDTSVVTLSPQLTI